MDEKNIQMKKEIMSRVKTVYMLRSLRPLIIELLLLVGSLVTTSFLVSIPSVLANVSRSERFLNGVNYLTTAFLHTDTVVKITLLATAIVGVFLIKDFVKNIRSLYVARLA